MHISVCACTYKRPEFLERLLAGLVEQEADGLFTYSVVVTDNDSQRSAEPIVAKFAASSPIPVTYCVEPRQNICLARNTAIAHSRGEFVAFIDDDEFPEKRWLVNLFKACNTDGVAGVLGPVKSYFDEAAPQWVVRGGFYDRPTHSTGFVIDWIEGRTGNVLLKTDLFASGEPPFDPSFHRGGDTDFFRRMIEKGRVFIWCDEAVVYEEVPPVRWTRAFLLKRALLRGKLTLKNPSFGARSVATSAAAVAAYSAALPFALMLGQHRFMNILVRLCDHLGKLLAVARVNPVRSPYVTD
jgi:succinoglycan biosynthesis protein ExoM